MSYLALLTVSIFLKIYLFLFQRERKCEQEQGRGVEGDRQADSPLGGESNVGLDPRITT